MGKTTLFSTGSWKSVSCKFETKEEKAAGYEHATTTDHRYTEQRLYLFDGCLNAVHKNILLTRHAVWWRRLGNPKPERKPEFQG